MSGYSVRLRDHVNYKLSSTSVDISHSIWESKIDLQLLDSSTASDLFSLPGSEVNYNEEDNLLAFLRCQGCLTHPKRERYTSAEALEIFGGASLDWYRVYYEHQLWDRLKSGVSTRNELLTWVIHNYHVSINSGITHARISAYAEEDMAEHEQCSLEEYWHADSFFFADKDELFTSKETIKHYIALPSTHAFQLQLRYMSDHDPNGYKMFSYFQERTIMFSNESFNFYDQIEKKYNVRGLFDGWRKHISLDEELGHSEIRRDILSGQKHIYHNDLVKSINNARTAFLYLVWSLDEIVSVGSSSETVVLRLPYKASNSENSISKTIRDFGKNAYNEAGFKETIISLLNQKDTKIDQDTIERAICSVRSGAFARLGRSVDHDEIMFSGKVARMVSKVCNQEVDVINSLKIHLSENAVCSYSGYLSSLLTSLTICQHYKNDNRVLGTVISDVFERVKYLSTNGILNIEKFSINAFMVVEIFKSDHLITVTNDIDPNFA